MYDLNNRLSGTHNVKIDLPEVFYFHGTTSRSLVLFPRTDFKLYNPTVMLAQTGYAPLCGELSSGLFGINSTPTACFGSTDRGHNYDLETVLSGYANTYTERFELCANLKRAIRQEAQTAFGNGHSLLLNSAMLIQYGDELPECFSPGKQQEYKLTIETGRHALFLLKLLNHKLYPNPEITAKLKGSEKQSFAKTLKQQYSLAHILSKIQAAGFALEDIYRDPTEDKLDAIITALQLEDGTALFTHIPSIGVTVPLNSSRVYDLGKALGAGDFGGLLELYLESPLSLDDWAEFSPRINNHIADFELRLQALNQIMSGKVQPIYVTKQEQALFDQAFPIVLVYSGMDIKEVGAEFRSTRALQIGKDIMVVATDTEEHAQTLLHYFEAHQMAHIQVILTEDLLRLTRQQLYLYIARDELHNAEARKSDEKIKRCNRRILEVQQHKPPLRRQLLNVAVDQANLEEAKSTVDALPMTVELGSLRKPLVAEQKRGDIWQLVELTPNDRHWTDLGLFRAIGSLSRKLQDKPPAYDEALFSAPLSTISTTEDFTPQTP